MILIVGVGGMTARCVEFALDVESQVMLLEVAGLDCVTVWVSCVTVWMCDELCDCVHELCG